MAEGAIVLQEVTEKLQRFCFGNVNCKKFLTVSLFELLQNVFSPCFHRSIGHVISRETENLQVPYYVDKNFEKNYQGAELQELEKTVEKDYIDYIQTSCWKEKQQSKLYLLQVPACTLCTVV